MQSLGAAPIQVGVRDDDEDDVSSVDKADLVGRHGDMADLELELAAALPERASVSLESVGKGGRPAARSGWDLAMNSPSPRDGVGLSPGGPTQSATRRTGSWQMSPLGSQASKLLDWVQIPARVKLEAAGGATRRDSGASDLSSDFPRNRKPSVALALRSGVTRLRMLKKVGSDKGAEMELAKFGFTSKLIRRSASGQILMEDINSKRQTYGRAEQRVVAANVNSFSMRKPVSGDHFVALQMDPSANSLRRIFGRSESSWQQLQPDKTVVERLKTLVENPKPMEEVPHILGRPDTTKERAFSRASSARMMDVFSYADNMPSRNRRDAPVLGNRLAKNQRLSVLERRGFPRMSMSRLIRSVSGMSKKRAASVAASDEGELVQSSVPSIFGILPTRPTGRERVLLQAIERNILNSEDLLSPQSQKKDIHAGWEGASTSGSLWGKARRHTFGASRRSMSQQVRAIGVGVSGSTLRPPPGHLNHFQLDDDY